MLKTSRCFALSALIFVSVGSLCLAGTEPLFYIYHGQPKALTLDSACIAVRVNSTVVNSHAGAVPLSLATQGFSDADVVAQPVPGWVILNARNALTRSRTSGLLAASAEDASSVHALIASLLVSGDPTIEFVSPVFRDEAGNPIILTPTVLIGFQKDFSANRQSQLLTAVPEGAEQQKMEFPQLQTQRWDLHSHDGFVALDRANTLAQTPGVAYAELDMIVTGHGDLIPSDPLFAQSWGLKNTGQSGGQVGFDLDATSAWDITTGSSSVIVLILDTGVQQNHPDINQIIGKDFTSDAASNPNGGPFGTYDNHGTWVAGCVSGLINNGLGTTGIAPGVKIASARCYNNGQSNGTYTFQFSWVADALNWGQSIGARISNNSNHYDQPSSEIENAYANTRANGMVHFASAGNDGTASISYPSSISSVNSVGAANRFGERSSFSQYGIGLKYLAPGEEIYTTDRTGSAGGAAGDYVQVNGTSFASPYAAGVAALIISQTPSLSVADVESQLQTSCRDMGPAGYDSNYGYGIVDASRALERITSNLNPPSGQIGSSFSYQITASNNPTSYSANGLPSGLLLNTATGLISGIPTASGNFQVVVTAHGPGDATATVQIVIIGPNITSSLANRTVDSGTSFTYQITATNNPSSYDASGLPPGLQIDIATGLITGTPNVPGSYSITLIAYTTEGDATASLTVNVLAPRITSGSYTDSALLGGSFNYQITSTQDATSYEVSGLPAGLYLDPATGVISGIPTLSGTYDITVIAHTPFGDATGTLEIVVSSPPDTPLATFNFFPTAMVADAARGRVYFAVENVGIVVLDVNTLTIITTIPTPEFVVDLTISADGSTLWAPNFAYQSIGRIDLNTLTPLPAISYDHAFQQIREGFGGRLYIVTEQNGIQQLNPATGAQLQFSPDPTNSQAAGCVIEVSPDRKTLYVAVGTYSSSATILAKYDISTATPVLLQRTTQTDYVGYYQSFALSHDGKRICLVTNNDNASRHGTTDYHTPERDTNDLTKTYGFLDVGDPLASCPIAFSANDVLVFQAPKLLPAVDVFDASSCRQVRSITLPRNSHPGKFIVDGTNTYLFVTDTDYSYPIRLRVYPVNPSASHSSGPPPPHRLINVSTRTFVQTGDNVEIGGFIIRGDQPKKVVLRAIGPSLAAFDLPAVTDPVLELHDATGAVIVTNDNWNSHRQDVMATGLAPGNEHEAVIVTSLAPGNYTAILKGLNGATGTALFELYDVDPTNSRVANISTRANVGTGDNVMIGGFIIGGDQPTKVIMRAIGPSLSQFGISTALLDPVLELHDGSGNLVSQNDDWRSDQEQLITNSGLAPSDDHESAIIATLPPGNYTAIVRGKNNTSGIGLVEVYNLESN